LHESEELIEHALHMSALKKNIYVEGRTVQRDAQWRGKMHETCWVFALVIDSDGDKGRAWAGDASLVVETSPGNHQYWFFLDEAITAEEARRIGAGMRATTKTDSDTGVPVQPYRVAGLLNHPNSKKRARGRTVSPTRILAHRRAGEGLWTAQVLQRRFPPPPVRSKHVAAPVRRVPSQLLGQSKLTPRQILDKYNIHGWLRQQLLHGGPLGSEDRSGMRWNLACFLQERGVPAGEASVVLMNSEWSRERDDDVARVVEKIWSR
jgi:hypothetical protein